MKIFQNIVKKYYYKLIKKYYEKGYFFILWTLLNKLGYLVIRSSVWAGVLLGPCPPLSIKSHRLSGL